MNCTIKPNIEEWTLDQFSALLMLHAAHADLDYSKDERLKILEFVSEEELIVIEKYYQNSTDGQILQVILTHKAHFFPNHEVQQQMLQNLKLIFAADGEISKLEQTQYEFLGRLITDTES